MPADRHKKSSTQRRNEQVRLIELKGDEACVTCNYCTQHPREGQVCKMMSESKCSACVHLGITAGCDAVSCMFLPGPVHTCLLTIFLGDHIDRDHAKVAEELEEAEVEATAATNRAVELLSKVARLRKQYKLINERFKVKMAHESAFLEQEDRERGVPLSLEVVDMSFLEDPVWVAEVMGVDITKGSLGSVGGTF